MHIGTIFVFVISLALPSAPREDLAATAISKCCDSIQRISTLQCQVECREYQGQSDLVVESKATYIRSNETYRILEDCTSYLNNKTHKTKLDIFCDGRITKDKSQVGTEDSWGIRSPTKPSPSKCNAFNHCLFNIIAPRYSTYKPAKEFFGILKITSARIKKDANGRDGIEVCGTCNIDDLDCDYTFKFDEGWNYIITAMTIDCKLNGQRTVRHFFHVDSVFEAARGIYVPNSIARETYLDGGLLWHSQVVVSNIGVNSLIPPQLLTFKFPDGIEIFDSIRSTRYRVDESGKRISPETPVSGGGFLPPSK